MENSSNTPAADSYESIKQAAFNNEFLTSLGDDGLINAVQFSDWLKKNDVTPKRFSEESALRHGPPPYKVNKKGDKIPIERGVGESTVKALKSGKGGNSASVIRNTIETLYHLKAFTVQKSILIKSGANHKVAASGFINAPKHLVGSWFGFHLTIGLKEVTVLARTEVQIYPDGRCELMHQVGNQKYAGGITEFHDGVVTIVTSSVDDEPDVIYWKIEYNRLVRSEQLSGGWFGVDFVGKIRAGKLLFSDKKVENDDEAVRLLNACHDVTASPPNTNKLDDEFDLKKVWEAIRLAKVGVEVRVITSFIPNWNGFVQELAKLHKDKKPVWRILFMDPDLEQLVNARFKLRSDEPDDSDLNDEETTKEQLPVKSSISREADILLRQRKVNSIDVEVRYSSAWPVGMGFLIEDTVLFLGLMYATKTAADAPVLEIRDQTSNAWNYFQDDFDEIWSKSSRPAWKKVPPISAETAN